MKLNTSFLVLFLIISIKSKNILDEYSIEGFKENMKKDGLFQIIQSIRYYYGLDVAIISCEELNKNHNGNCKRLVTDYMKDKIDPESETFSGKEEEADEMGEEEIAEDGDETTQGRKGLIIEGGERGANAGGGCRTTGSGDIKTDKDEYGYERTSENEDGYKGTTEDEDDGIDEDPDPIDISFESPDSICQLVQFTGKQIKQPLNKLYIMKNSVKMPHVEDALMKKFNQQTSKSIYKNIIKRVIKLINHC